MARASTLAPREAEGEGAPDLAPAAQLPARSRLGGAVAAFPEPSSWHSAHPRRRRPVPARIVSFVVVVVLPIAVAGLYLFLVAADQYVCEFRFSLRSAEPAVIDRVALFATASMASPTGPDSQAVVQYVASRAIVDRLAATLDLRSMFARPQADFLARLPEAVPIEELVRYWRRQVDAFYDAADGTITIRVRAFTPPDALTLAHGILTASETLVNTLSARARRDAMRHDDDEVTRAEARLKSALAALRDFRDKEGLIDPTRTADATSALAARLRSDLVDAQAQRATLRSTMREDAPSIKVLDARIRSLRGQWRALRGEVTAADDPSHDALSHSIDAYEQLDSDRKFAEAAYQHALAALDRSRENADRQQVYLASFVPPTLPEEALYPRRWRALGVVGLIAFAAWAIGGLILQSIRDHL